MTAIISNNNLGVVSSSRDNTGVLSVGGAGRPGNSGENMYVNIATGNLIVQRQDEILKARGMDVDALLTYNSLGVLDGDNNDNWRIGFYRQIKSLTGTVNTAGSTVTRVDADGAELIYVYDSATTRYVSTSGDGSYHTLRYNGTTNQWTWTDGGSRATETYGWTNGIGSLSKRTDTAGNTISYLYGANGLLSQVSNPGGEIIYLDYTGLNLTRMRMEGNDGGTSTRVLYAYDASNRLTKVTVDLSPNDNSISDGKTYVSNYTYDRASRRIATLTQSDGTSLAFAYDTSGRISSIKDALGNQCGYAYDSLNRITTVTDALGQQSTWRYDAQGQLLQTTSPDGNGGTLSRSYVYNANGDLIQITNELGQLMVMQYDANGNQTLQRDSLGNTITRTFDSNNQLMTETAYLTPDPDGADPTHQNTLGAPSTPLTTRYVYDAAGKSQLRFTISPEGRVTEYRYDSFGQRIASIDHASTQYASTKVLESDLATWVVSSAVDKTRSLRTDYAWDFRGQLSSSTVWASVDSTGNGVAGTAATTTYVYDARGLLLRTIAPLGGAAQTTSYVYDGLGRVVSVTNGLGELTSTSYDDAGNKVTVTAANGLVTTSTFDAAGRLVSMQRMYMVPSATPGNVVQGYSTERYYYDKGDRLRMIEDATGVRTWLLYDDANRKVGEVDGNGSLAEFIYNTAGQLTRTIRYAAAASTTGLTVNADGSPSASALALRLGELRPLANGSQDQSEWRAYDSAGRLVKTVDAAGGVTETQYDGASRVVSVIAYANRISTAGLGNQPTAASIAPVANSSADQVTRNFHDNDGLLRATLDAEGYLVEILYDAAGREVRRIAYATVTNASMRNTGTLTDLRPATNDADISSWRFYDDRNQLVAEIDGEKYLTEYLYDANGNQRSRIRYANQATAAISAGVTLATLRPATNVADQTSNWTYDVLNRVASQADFEGTQTTYGYDTAGNLTQVVKAAGTSEARTSSTSYNHAGQISAEINGRDMATSYALDLAGRRISQTDANGNRTLYYYDADDQLVYTINALGEVSANVYNALEQRTAEIRYGSRLANSALSAMTGGLLTSSVQNTINSLANATLDSRTNYTYHLDGTLASSTDALGKTTSYQYDAFGNRTSVTTPISSSANLEETYAYDRRNLQTSMREDALGLNVSTSMQYDAFGRVISQTDGRNDTSQQSYDRLGRAVQTRDRLNQTQSSTYDAFDRVLTQTDSLGSVTSYSYSAATRSVSIRTPEGITVTTARNRHGETQTVTDGRGNITTYVYDAIGNLTQTTSPAGQITTQRYDDADRLIETTDANNIKTAISYDAANRVLSRTVDPNATGYTGLNLVTAYTWDARGQQIRVTDPSNVATEIVYDLNGQVTRRTVDSGAGRLNLDTLYSYDDRGKTLTVTDEAGGVTQYGYDKLGRRIEERVDPAGLNLHTRYEYDGNDNLVAKIDASNNRTRYAYDDEDRLRFEVDALGQVKETRYDAEGRVSSTAGYANPISLVGLGTTVSVADITARLVSDTARDNSESRVYDRDGRLSYSTDGAGAVTKYDYDANGNVVKMTAYANLPVSSTDIAGQFAATADQESFALRSTLTFNVAVAGTYTFFTTSDDGSRLYINGAEVINNDQLQAASQVTASVTLTAGTHMLVQTYFDYNNDNSNDFGIISGPAGTSASNNFGVSFGPINVEVFNFNGDYVSLNTAGTANLGLTSTAAGAALTLVGRVSAIATDVTQMGKVVIADSARDQVISNVYDTANRVTYSVDGIGAVTKYDYDANGNVVQKTAFAQSATSNLALGATAAQSSTYVGEASRAVDGNANGVWNNGSVTQTNPEANPWWQVDLGTTKLVTSIELYNRTDSNPERLSNFHVFISSTALTGRSYSSILADGSVTKYYVSGQAPAMLSLTAGALGRYVRIQLSGTNRLSLAEVRVMGGDYVADASRDQITRNVYDTANRLTHAVDGMGAVTKYDYDASGNVVQKTAYANRIASTAAASTVVANANLDQVTRNLYDAASRLAYAVDGAGAVTKYDYDANGNVVKKIAYANRIESNEAASAVGANASLDQVTRYVYDAANRLTYTVDGTGAVRKYDYDASGNVIRKTAYANRIASTDAASAVGSNASLDQVARNMYDAANRLTRTIDANGAVRELRYDANGNVIQEKAFARGVTRTVVVRAKADNYNGSPMMELWLNGSKIAQRLVTNTSYQDYSFMVEWPIGSTASLDVVFANDYYIPLFGDRNLYVEKVTIDGVAYQSTSAQYDRASALFGPDSAFDGIDVVPGQPLLGSNGALRFTVHTSSLLGTDRIAYAQASNADQVTRNVYDAANRLTYAVDGTGAVTKYDYDAGGNVVTKTVYASRIASTDAASAVAASASLDQVTRYVYDAANQLTYAVDGTGAVTKYDYDASGNVVTMTAYANRIASNEAASAVVANASLDQATRNVYDAANRLTYAVDGTGAVTKYDYDSYGNLVRETGYASQLDLLSLPVILADAAAIANLITANPALDRVTAYVYDAAGRRTRTALMTVGVYAGETDAQLMANGASGLASRTENQASLYTTNYYDAFGNVVANRDTAGSLRYQAFDSMGRMRLQVDAKGYVTQYDYDAFGNVTSLKRYARDIDDVIRGTWNPLAAPALGTLLGLLVTDAADRTIASRYDARNQLIEVIQPEVYAYDGSTGQLASPTTRYVYNAFGQRVQTQTQMLDGGWLNSYSYFDLAGREVATVDAGRYVTERRYDAFGNAEWVKEYASQAASAGISGYSQPLADSSDRTVEFAYDRANRKTSETRDNVRYSTASNGTFVNGDLVNQYDYDAFGNQVRMRDNNNKATLTYYDAANRVRAITTPTRAIDGNASFTGLTEFVRDAYGNVIRQTERANGASNASIVSNANPTGYATSDSTNDRVNIMRYDSWGRLVQATDAMGNSQGSSYDAAGNLAKQWSFLTLANNVTRTVFKRLDYDREGQLIALTDPASSSGATSSVVRTQMRYNAFGELVARGIDGVGGVAGLEDGWSEYFDFDNNGRVWRSNSGDGVNKVMLYDLQGNLTTEIRSAGTDLKLQSSAASANGLAETRRIDNTYDALGRLLQQRQAERWVGNSIQRPVINRGYDRWGNVVSVNDPGNTAWITEYAYDAGNQLIRETKPQANLFNGSGYANQRPVTEYYYDYAGNQVAVKDARGNVNGTTYDSLGNVLQERHADGGVITHAYNAFGDEVQRTDAMGNVTRYEYNKLGQRERIIRPQADFHSVNERVFEHAATPVTGYYGWDQTGPEYRYWAGRYTHDQLGETLLETRSVGVKSGYKATFDDNDNDAPSIHTNNGNLSGNDSWGVNRDVYSLRIESTNTAHPVQLDNDHSSSIQMRYDQRGQKLYIINSGGQRTDYTYDLRGNIVQTVQLGVSTSNAYDCLNRKVSETDANGNTSTWRYDYFGRLVEKNTLGTNRNTYSYDLAGQLKEEFRFNGVQGIQYQYSVRYDYDNAGQLTRTAISYSMRIGDESLDVDQRTATYGYDLAGRRTSEIFDIRSGTVSEYHDFTTTTTYQNQGMTYNALGQLVMVTAGNDGTIEYRYDLAGNRIYQLENITANTSSGARASYFAYDAMNRLILVDGAANNNAHDNANLTDARGMRVAYDRNGNRISEIGGSGGWRQNMYEYDALNRLVTTLRYTYNWNNGDSYHVLDKELSHWYDRADRMVGSTLDQDDPDGQSKIQLSKFDSNGRLNAQAVVLGSSFGYGTESLVYNDDYDAVGNLKRSFSYGTGYVNRTEYSYGRFGDGYKQTRITTTQTTRDPGQWALNQTAQVPSTGITILNYDFNGFLKSIDDQQGDKDQSFVNDINGFILQKTKNGTTTKNLIVNSRVLGNYQVGAGSIDFVDAQGVDWSASAGPQNSYRVNAGDTLRSIALSVYGDAQLWYLIADANGVSDGSLRVGEMLVLPKQVGAIHNDANTFTPYSAARIIGDTNPTVPMPTPTQASSCHQTGIIIAAIIASVAITILAAALTTVTLGAAGVPAFSATGILISMIMGAAGGAAASMANQGVMIAGGLQRQMNWTEVGIGAATGLFTTGISSGAGALVKNVVKGTSLAAKILNTSVSSVKAAQGAVSTANAVALLAAKVGATSAAYAALNVANEAIGQGIRIAAKEQAIFDWKTVAAAAISGAVGGVGGMIGENGNFRSVLGGIAGDLVGSASGNLINNNGVFDSVQFAQDATSSLSNAVMGRLAFHRVAKAVKAANKDNMPSQNLKFNAVMESAIAHEAESVMIKKGKLINHADLGETNVPLKTQKDGYFYAPFKSKDMVKMAVGHNMGRLANNKLGYSLIAQDQTHANYFEKVRRGLVNDLAGELGLPGRSRLQKFFNRGQDAYQKIERNFKDTKGNYFEGLRKNHGNKEWALHKLEAAFLLNIDNNEQIPNSKILSDLDPEKSKIYLLGHGSPGTNELSGGTSHADFLSENRLDVKEIVKQLARGGLGKSFVDIRSISCSGADALYTGNLFDKDALIDATYDPVGKKKPFGEHLADEFGKEGFGNVKVKAYHGLGLMYADSINGGSKYQHTRIPKMTDAKGNIIYDPKQYVRSSDVAEIFKPGVYVDGLLQ